MYWSHQRQSWLTQCMWHAVHNCLTQQTVVRLLHIVCKRYLPTGISKHEQGWHQGPRPCSHEDTTSSESSEVFLQAFVCNFVVCIVSSAFDIIRVAAVDPDVHQSSDSYISVFSCRKQTANTQKQPCRQHRAYAFLNCMYKLWQLLLRWDISWCTSPVPIRLIKHDCQDSRPKPDSDVV